MFRGSMVALVTPMLEDGAVDHPALDKLIEFHIKNKTDAIVAVGTTGESATLTFSEHCALIKYVVEKVKGRLPVIAGTGANSTQEAVELTRCAMRAGADAALLVTPYYNKPTQEGLYLHYKAVADAVPLPQILYNVPGRTACDLLPETVERLSTMANIIGIKEATGDLSRLDDILQRCGSRIECYSGDDATSREFVLRGGLGSISVTANVAPRQVREMLAAALEGDADKALDIDRAISHLHDDLFVEANPIPVKWAIYEMGLAGKTLRLPMTPLSEQYRPALRDALLRAGIELR